MNSAYVRAYKKTLLHAIEAESGRRLQPSQPRTHAHAMPKPEPKPKAKPKPNIKPVTKPEPNPNPNPNPNPSPSPNPPPNPSPSPNPIPHQVERGLQAPSVRLRPPGRCRRPLPLALAPTLTVSLTRSSAEKPPPSPSALASPPRAGRCRLRDACMHTSTCGGHGAVGVAPGGVAERVVEG